MGCGMIGKVKNELEEGVLGKAAGYAGKALAKSAKKERGEIKSYVQSGRLRADLPDLAAAVGTIAGGVGAVKLANWANKYAENKRAKK